MTCIVSARTSHGIVLAGDSLGTGYGNKVLGQQKIFSMFGVYGIGVYGWGEIDCEDGRIISIYDFLQEHEGSLRAQAIEVPTLTETAKAIGQQLLRARAKYVNALMNGSEANIVEFFKGLYVGLHVNGYEHTSPLTCRVMINQEARLFIEEDPRFPFENENYFEMEKGEGVLVNGEKQRGVPQLQTAEEARAYAVSIVKEAAKNTDTIGGEIKVGIVRPSFSFEWMEPDWC